MYTRFTEPWCSTYLLISSCIDCCLVDDITSLKMWYVPSPVSVEYGMVADRQCSQPLQLRSRHMRSIDRTMEQLAHQQRSTKGHRSRSVHGVKASPHRGARRQAVTTYQRLQSKRVVRPWSSLPTECATIDKDVPRSMAVETTHHLS